MLLSDLGVFSTSLPPLLADTVSHWYDPFQMSLERLVVAQLLPEMLASLTKSLAGIALCKMCWQHLLLAHCFTGDTRPADLVVGLGRFSSSISAPKLTSVCLNGMTSPT